MTSLLADRYELLAATSIPFHLPLDLASCYQDLGGLHHDVRQRHQDDRLTGISLGIQARRNFQARYIGREDSFQ